MQKICCGFWGGAPNTHTCEHCGPKKGTWIPTMVVFETHRAKKYVVGSGVKSQTSIPLHALGPKRCFWIPKVVVFETHHAKKYAVGSGMAP